MTTTDINTIAAEARRLLEGISKVNAKHDTLVADRNARVKPLLEKVHHTLTVLKQPVEGVTSWNAWAQKAGWSKRNLNFILNGRPSQKKKESTGNSSSRSSFLKRIAEAKAKLTEVQSQKDAPFAEGETRDMRQFEGKVDPIIDTLFEEFLKLIAPDGYEVLKVNRGWIVQSNWNEQWNEEPPALTHYRVSKRKSLCEHRYINRPKIKGKVFAKDGETATCPDCVRFEEERKRKNEEFNNFEYKPSEPSDPIKVKLTNAQMREVMVVLAPATNAKKLTHNASTVIFKADTYQEVAKELVLALEQRKDQLEKTAREDRHGFRKGDLLDWNNRSEEGIAAKKKQAEWKGAIKAIEGTIVAIIAGDLKDDDPARHAREWYEQHQEEVQTELDAASERLDAQFEVKWGNQETLSEPAKNLQAAIVAAGDVAVPKPWEDDHKAWKQKSWSDRVCTPGSPERKEHLRQLLRRQEFPYVDPNEGDDDESDEKVL